MCEPMQPGWKPEGWRWGIGTRLRKIKGSSWQGPVVGFYTTTLTPRGYAVESERETNSVQLYPEAALELVETSFTWTEFSWKISVLLSKPKKRLLQLLALSTPKESPPHDPAR